jgi:hypothetical protein
MVAKATVTPALDEAETATHAATMGDGSAITLYYE